MFSDGLSDCIPGCLAMALANVPGCLAMALANVLDPLLHVLMSRMYLVVLESLVLCSAACSADS